MEYLISFILIVLSALFSGLTLGILSLDATSLKRRAKNGDREAAVIYPIREKGNLILIKSQVAGKRTVFLTLASTVSAASGLYEILNSATGVTFHGT
jgi:metal transporter CNNM